MSAYPFQKQVKIMAATTTLHNFIRGHNFFEDIHFCINVGTSTSALLEVIVGDNVWAMSESEFMIQVFDTTTS